MRRPGPLVALCAVLLVLAGCGGSNPKPKTLPTPSSSATSSSPTPSAPVMPAAAREKTKAGAIAFAASFIATLNYSGATGNTKPLRALFVPLCTRCEAIADGIEGTYAAGGSITGGTWHSRSFKFYGIQNDVAFVDVLVDYDRQELVSKQGATPKVFPPSRRNLKAFNLRWGGTKWAASALDPTR